MKKQEQLLRELKDQKDTLQSDPPMSSEGPRWSSASTSIPIKKYGQHVLKNRTPLNSTANRTNSGRKSSGQPKLASGEKLTPIQNSASSTPLGSGIIGTNTSLRNKENQSQDDFFKDTMSSEPLLSSDSSLKKPTPKQQQRPSISKQQQQEVKKPSSTESATKPTPKEVPSTTSIEANTDEVSKFLQEAGLPQYIPIFKDHGFDDMDTVKEIQTKHLVDMKIPAGHQIKITKRVEALRQTTPTSANRNPQPTTQKLPTQSAESSQINLGQLKSSTFGQNASLYVELEGPSKNASTGEDRPVIQGEFNEAESHQSFLEALNEWRSGKAKPMEFEKKEPVKKEKKESRGKKVRFADAPVEKEEKGDDVDYISMKAKKPFFFTGEASWDVKKAGHEEHATDMSPRHYQLKPKTSCWNCYKLIPEEEIIQVGQRSLCSETCAKTYRDFNSARCMKKGCEKSFLKEEGIMEEGRWFCSEKCIPTKEEMLLEEQRLLSKFAKESGQTETQQQQEEEEEKEPEEENNENKEVEVELDLGVEVSDKKEVLSLAELEEKYKNLNKMAEKAEEGDDQFEDSLN